MSKLPTGPTLFNPMTAKSPTCQIMTVTPDLAEQWLKANTSNRKPRKDAIRRYARDMAAGRWLFNPQPVSFGTDGTIIDGQHRLMAIVSSGATVTLTVWFDVPIGSRAGMDDGITRSLSDISNMTKNQSAVTHSMMRGPARKTLVSTKQERLSFFARYQSQIERVISFFPSTMRGVTQASVLGAIARASLYMKDADVARFCEVLWSGMGDQGTRDLTVIKLRDRLLMSDVRRASQPEYAAMTLAALRAFDENRAISKIYAIDTDPFPLPTDSTNE